jgi:hypothetical protein
MQCIMSIPCLTLLVIRTIESREQRALPVNSQEAGDIRGYGRGRGDRCRVGLGQPMWSETAGEDRATSVRWCGSSRLWAGPRRLASRRPLAAGSGRPVSSGATTRVGRPASGGAGAVDRGSDVKASGGSRAVEQARAYVSWGRELERANKMERRGHIVPYIQSLLTVVRAGYQT